MLEDAGLAVVEGAACEAVTDWTAATLCETDADTTAADETAGAEATGATDANVVCVVDTATEETIGAAD